MSSEWINILILDMFEILSNIYSKSITILFETFFVVFGDCRTCFLRKNISKSYISVFFYPKNSRTASRKTSMTQEWTVTESCGVSRWVKFLIFYRLVYNMLYHLSDLILAWSASWQLCQKVSHQNSRIVYEIFSFLIQAVIIIHVLDQMIVIELLLWNWKEW